MEHEGVSLQRLVSNTDSSRFLIGGAVSCRGRGVVTLFVVAFAEIVDRHLRSKLSHLVSNVNWAISIPTLIRPVRIPTVTQPGVGVNFPVCMRITIISDAR